jgi:glycosyltransferase involved in cell wall biosynthesis
MKIAQVVSNVYNTSDDANHGINVNAALLTNGLAERNNDVTLFASSGSNTKAKLISVLEGPTKDLSENIKRQMLNLLISQCYQMASDFDIIHSHFTIATSFFENLVNTPTVHSIHSPLDLETLEVLKRFKDLNYISFSKAQRTQAPDLNWVANIYHGIDVAKFPFNPHPESYLLCLGRVTKEKGVHLAIQAAKEVGLPLIIAGRSYPEEGYWHEEIEKHIDGKMIRYVGEADFERKIDLLKNAKALLFPTQYNEVFGLVMIEAMACGTPVIAWNNGSVPEVVQNKKTGYVVDSVAEMVKAIKAIDKINREATRKRVQDLFSVGKMVTGYERVYLRIIEEYAKKRKAQ